MAKMVMMTDGGQRSSKPKPPVIKGVKTPQPIKGQAVDRVTSYMETDGTPGAGAVGRNINISANQSAPNMPNMPGMSTQKITGIVPTTSNSVTQPVQPVVTPKPAPKPAAAPVQQGPTTQELIQQMIDAQRQQRIAELQAALEREMTGFETSYGDQRTSLDTAKGTHITNLENALREALSHLDAEQAKVQPYYYDARNQAASQSDVGAMNFAQYMASRGVKGGAGGMPEIYRQSALQGQIGALDQQEAANLAEIDRHRSLTQGTYESDKANILGNYATDISNLEQMLARSKQGMQSAYEQDLAAANAGIDAQGLQAYINQLNADRSFELQEGGLTGQYKGAPTLQAEQYEFERGIQEGQLTGTYQGSPTLQKQMFEADMAFKNKQLAIDQAYKNGQLSLQRASAARAANAAAYQREKDRLNEQFKQEQWQYQKQQDSLNRQFQYDELAAKTAGAKQSSAPDISGYVERAIRLQETGPSNVMTYINSLPVSNQDKLAISRGLGY